ncbi:MAG: MazG family protein [Dermatophilus congolensis]|nr:MazG family protein [Dermatophilus congolensis]
MIGDSGRAPVDLDSRSGVEALVAVVDRLRSPGGCPWDADQTHESLARFAIEEAYELADAIAGGERGALVDELGDVLFQVAFHARLGQEHAEPFDIDDVADGIVAKLRRRHPHVFADVDATTKAAIEANWDAIKAAEHPERTSPLDGIPASFPPLERAAKIASRYHRAGRLDEVRAALDAVRTGNASSAAETAETDIGDRLLSVVTEAVEDGVDPGTALVEAVSRLESTLRRTGMA